MNVNKIKYQLRLLDLKGDIRVLAGAKYGQKNCQKIFRSIFNVAHCAAPCCIVLLPIRIDSVR